MLNRRRVLCASLSAAATKAIVSTRASAEEPESDGIQVIDTNVSLFQWPFRRLPLDQTDALVTKLRSLGVDQAWAGSFEGLLHRDISAVNERLAEACANRKELVAIGSVNPTLPSWEVELERCAEKHQMPGIRLHPNYHGYSLGDPRFYALLDRAALLNRFVQIAVTMEDARTQHKMLRVTDVNLAPLADVMTRIPAARVQLLNYRPRWMQLERFASTANLFFDTSRVEGTDGVPETVNRLPAGRVLFGSDAPFLIPEAALIRVHESGRLNLDRLRDVYAGNARRMAKEMLR